MEELQNQHEILRGMARALFVTAWADHEEEEEGRYHGGEDYEKIAPPTSLDAIIKAAGLEAAYSVANGHNRPGGTSILFGKACEADGMPETEQWGDWAFEFGWYLAMAALGHGVHWFDDHARFELVEPDIENDWYVMEPTPGLLRKLRTNDARFAESAPEVMRRNAVRAFDLLEAGEVVPDISDEAPQCVQDVVGSDWIMLLVSRAARKAYDRAVKEGDEENGDTYL